ncbi:MAG: 4a-hydroxytetrahydrobiopterin dehydratase [Proteobacteria bacterium]|nr:4a-hydroxytetrahydrobiopterin dehydratase [Pseudomonadota bacterium]
MNDLTEKHCKACEGGVNPLTLNEAQYLLKKIPQWKISEDGKEISRIYSFKNYYHTMAFVNALAYISHIENHHPDLEVSYNKCNVRYSTHAIGGLSENDFICAAKSDLLLAMNK